MENQVYQYSKTYMKQTQLLLLLTALLVLSTTQGLVFDLRSVKYTPSSDYWTVDIPCSGGSGKYEYEFDLPDGWKSQANTIKIPTQYTNQTNNQYVVRCKVKDTQSGSHLERSLVFKPFVQGSTYSIQVSDNQYFYGHSGLSSDRTLHGVDVLNRLGYLTRRTSGFTGSSSSYSSSGYSQSGSYATGVYGTGNHDKENYNGNKGLRGSQGSYSQDYTSSSSGSYSHSSSSSYSSSSSSSYYSSSGHSSSISSYSSLPSFSQLDVYIAQGGVVQIIQVIQLVVDSGLKCEAKSAYLSDLLGRIYAAVQVKTYTLNQLKLVVKTAIEQVQKLTIQIQTIKQSQAKLHLKELKFQLEGLIVQLKAAYDEYNTYNSNYGSYEAEIVSLESEITQINKRYSDVHQKITYLTQQVSQIDEEIAQYQQKIKQLRTRKQQLQQNITTYQTTYQEKDQRIKQIKTKIQSLKVKIAQGISQKQQLKQVYILLEQQINTVKEDIQVNEQRYAQFEKDIQSIKIEIQKYQQKTSELEIKHVTQCLDNLENSMSQIRESIDYLAYHCYQATDVEVDYDAVNRRGCFHFDKSQWLSYIDKSYSNLAQTIRSRITKAFSSSVIQISTVNIFSDIWKRNYGSCFSQDIQSKAKNYKNQKTYSFESDFSCAASYEGIQQSSGVIVNIQADSVQVRGDDGKDYSLKLGSCSKFEGQGKEFVPKKGQNVFWKGSKSNDHYKLHTCTCY